MSGRPLYAGAALLAASLVAVTGCGRHRSAKVALPPAAKPAHAPSAPAPLDWTESGVASWYGIPYDGRRTASGEVFDMHAMTAAHRTLPFNTWLEVTNLKNGKQVDVRITDRGPFIDGRIIDLSMGAAERIDMLRDGIVRVRVKVIRAPIPPSQAASLPAASQTSPAVSSPQR